MVGKNDIRFMKYMSERIVDPYLYILLMQLKANNQNWSASIRIERITVVVSKSSKHGLYKMIWPAMFISFSDVVSYSTIFVCFCCSFENFGSIRDWYKSDWFLCRKYPQVRPKHLIPFKHFFEVFSIPKKSRWSRWYISEVWQHRLIGRVS